MLARIYWSVWVVGTALIIMSGFGVVSPEIGWTGFVISCGAALLSYLPHRAAGARHGDPAVLTRAMLQTKDRGYDIAMEQLRSGGPVFFDGLIFAVHPSGELRLVTTASWPVRELDEMRVQQDVERAKGAFEDVARQAPEVAAAAMDKKLRVTLFSDFSKNRFEVCTIVDGQIDWRIKGKTH